MANTANLASNEARFPGTNSGMFDPNNPWQQMIAQAFQTTNLVEGALAVHHQPLFDTISYAAGATINEGNSHFFENVTQAASAKTLGQTNMPKANQLPSPQA